jgi:hypothetical protein
VKCLRNKIYYRKLKGQREEGCDNVTRARIPQCGKTKGIAFDSPVAARNRR